MTDARITKVGFGRTDATPRLARPAPVPDLPRGQNPLLDAALDAVARGWHILPVANVITAQDGSIACSCHRGAECTEIGKHPLYDLVKNGQSNATTDPEQIKRWWRQFPDASLAVVLVPSGLIAFDADFYKGDRERLAALSDRLGDLPETAVQQSGSGEGNHILFTAPGFPIRGELGGVTMRGRNYIVLAPSTHKSGGRYRWLDGLSPNDVAIAALPDTWKAALKKEMPIGNVGMPSVEEEPDWLQGISDEQRIKDMRAHLTKEPGEIMGESRPGMAWDVARTAARAYAVRDADAVWHALLEIYNPKCQPPYPEDKLAERLISAYEKAQLPAWGRHYVPAQIRRKDEGMGWFDRAKERVQAKAIANNEPGSARAPGVSRDEIRAVLKATQQKLARSGKSEKVLDGTILGRVLRGEQLTTHSDEDRDQAACDAIAAVVRHAPGQATPVQLAEILITSTLAAPDDIIEAITELRDGGIKGAGAPRSPLAAALVAAGHGAEPPADDQDVIARLRLGKDDVIRPCGSNIELILRYSAELRNNIRFNALTKAIEIAAGRFHDEPVNDLSVAIMNWLETEWELHATKNNVEDQLLRVARRYGSYDPVAEYLNALVWDGVPRIDKWLATYCRAEDTLYNQLVGSRFLISAAARGIAPGSKVDTVLVLEGGQGVKKSTAFRVLGGKWFSDTPLVLGDKDSYQATGSSWIIELAELSSIGNHEIEKHKAYLSAQSDMFRPPYGRVQETFLRHCVFGGTTNEDEYLNDDQNRRFWSVRVGRINIELLAADRDQLWAEAVHRYLEGMPDYPKQAPHLRWWFEDDDELALAAAVSAQRRAENPWIPMILDWYAKMKLPGKTFSGQAAPPRAAHFTMDEVALSALKINTSDLPRYNKQLGRALRAAGFKPRADGAARKRVWFKPEPAATLPPEPPSPPKIVPKLVRPSP